MYLISEIFKDLLRCRDVFWLRLIGLLVFCAGLSTFAAAVQTSEVTADEQVSEHWRGSYDLLIRPVSAVSEIEQETGLAEGNYLGTPGGGITLHQYELIRDLPNVEIAAPVATVGFLLNNTGTIGLQLDPFQPKTLYRILATLKSNPASRDNLLKEYEVYFAVPGDHLDANLFAWGSSIKDVIGTGQNKVYLSVGELPILWTLVAGIDPIQEAKLVGLDKALVSGEFLPADEALKQTFDVTFDRKALKIPILVSEQSYVDISVNMTVNGLNLRPDTLQELTHAKSEEEIDQFLSVIKFELLSPNNPPLLDQSLDLQSVLHPLSGMAVVFSPNSEPKGTQEGSFSSYNRNILLYPGHYKYETRTFPNAYTGQVVLQVNKQGLWGGEIQPQISALNVQDFSPEYLSNIVDVPSNAWLFRPLKAYEPPSFVLDVYGSYDFTRLIAPPDPLSYVPLGIYEPPLATKLFDENGGQVESSILSPELNPGGVIPRPPLALTTLQGAKYLLGREDFIDAIRVRVGGITTYTPESVTKIEQLATEITERTGLHVDIVAGSSPKKVLVYVPGQGYIEERWTTLGAAAKVTSGLNIANLTLFGCLLLATWVFLTTISQVFILSRWEEIGILKTFGWRTIDVIKLLLGQSLILGIFAAFLSIIVSSELSLALGLQLNWRAILYVSLTAPILYLVAGIVPILSITAQHPVTALRQTEVSLSIRFNHLFVPFNFIGLAFRQLWRRRIRALLSLTIVAVSTGLIVVLINIIIQLQGKLRVTLLGEFIALNIRPFHYLIMLTAVSMSILAVLENLLLGVLERSREYGLLSALGWQPRHISLSVVWEGIIIGALGGWVGGIIGLLIYYSFSHDFTTLAWLIANFVWIVATIFCLLVAVYPAVQASKFTQAQALAGSSNFFLIRQRRASNWILALGLLMIFLIGIDGIGGRNKTVRSIMEIFNSNKDPNSLTTWSASGEQILKHIKNISAFGPRDQGNPSEKKVADYLEKTLISAGLQVQRESFPLSILTVSRESKLLPALTLPDQNNSQVNSIAIHMEQLNHNELVSGPILFIQSTSQYPSPADVAGKILVIEDEPYQELNRNLDNLVFHYDIPASYLGAVSISLKKDDSTIRALLSQPKLIGSIPTTENVIGTIPGKERPNEEVWFIAHYDTNQTSPGADANSSGVGLLLELARIFAKQGSSVTLRFLFLTGTGSGLEGATSYAIAHEEEFTKVKAVLEIDQIGSWKHLLLGSPRFASAVSNQKKADTFLTELDFIKPLWGKRLNLDSQDVINRSQEKLVRSPLLSQDLSDLVDQALHTSRLMELRIQEQVLPSCSPNYLVFLYRGLPATILCGEGNDLAGSSYDTPDTLNPNQLSRVMELVFNIIENWSKEGK